MADKVLDWRAAPRLEPGPPQTREGGGAVSQPWERGIKKSKNNSVTIEELPNEILVTILSYLDFKDLGYCAQTSHRFRNISQYPSLWETVIEKGE